MNYKMDQTQKYFDLHPDRVTVVVSGSGYTFNALFTLSFADNNKGAGNVEQHKQVPSLSFYAGHYDRIKQYNTEITVYDTDDTGLEHGSTYRVYRTSRDQTPGTYQGVAWLI